MTETDVVIVGAGPTGLTLACDLARRGVEVRIVDHMPRSGSRGKGLQPRTLEVFDDLGVLDAVLATAVPYPVIRSYVSGRVAWEGRMAELREPTPDVPYPNLTLLAQFRTEQILRERLAELGVQVEQAELTRFEQDEDGVTATLDRASTVRCAYLVGADGGHSIVRRRLSVAFSGTTDEEDRLLLADVRADGLDHEHWHTWPDPLTREVKVGLCPLPGTDLFQFTAAVPPGDTPELSPATLQKILAEVSDVQIREATWMSLYRANVRLAERFRVGRVFLAGDAAHVHPPAGGQGLNTGVQDAYNLGWKLALGTALDTYEAERRPVAAAVLGLTTALDAKGYRAEAFRLSDDTGQLGLGYPDSPLAVGGGMAGFRAPDAPLANGRLFDVFRGPHFTLLGFGPQHAGTVARIAERHGKTVRAHTVGRPGEAVDLVDTDGHARRAYGTDGLVLVRPDGYIGAYDTDPNAYLSALL